MTVTEFTTRCATLDLPGNRALRATFTRGADGEPDRLVLSTGWRNPWREDGRSVELFGDAILTLIEALTLLTGNDGPPPLRAA